MSKRARQAALHFIDACNKGEATGILAAFGDEAQLHHDSGSYLSQQALAQFITEQLLTLPRPLTLTTIFAENDYALVELECLNKRGEGLCCRHALVFRVDDSGRILELSWYQHPGAPH